MGPLDYDTVKSDPLNCTIMNLTVTVVVPMKSYVLPNALLSEFVFVCTAFLNVTVENLLLGALIAWVRVF
jgi:hypothetical protein